MDLPPGVLTRHLHHLAMLGCSKETINTRRRSVTRMQRAISVPLLEADAVDLLAWREDLTVSPAVVAQYVSRAMAFFDWCVQAGLRDDNPAAGIPVPRTGRRLPRPASEDDVLLALEYAPARIRLWLVLAAWCGLRAKEISYLARESVLETAIPPVLLVARDATKGNRERVIPLSDFVLSEMRFYGLPRAGYVFPRYDGKPGPNTPARVSQLAGRHLHDCGIDASLHQLRHYFGTATYAATRDLRVVQELMGHATPVSTAGYTAFSSSGAVAAVNALPKPPRLRRVPSDGAA